MEAQELTLHKNIRHIILGGIIALSALMFSKCSRRTAVVVVVVVVGGGWWVVSSSGEATKHFHRPSCLAAISIAPRTHLVSTQAVFSEKKINARRQQQSL